MDSEVLGPAESESEVSFLSKKLPGLQMELLIFAVRNCIMTNRKKHDDKSFGWHHAQEVTTGFQSREIVGKISTMCLRSVAVVVRCLVDMGVLVEMDVFGVGATGRSHVDCE